VINITTPSEITKIYLVTNCYNDPNKVYIGKTINCRKSRHKKTYGKDITYDYIDEVESLERKDWKPLETFWIRYFRYLGFDVLNENEGGGGVGFHSDYTKQLISNSRIGNSYRKGKVNSPETRANISKNSKGKKKHSQEWKDWFTKKITGVKKSKECCDKKSKSMMGKQVKPYIPIQQFDKDGNFIQDWVGTSIASKSLKINAGDITACCRGKLKSAGKFVWKYKNK
jgi:hypothetical protein